MAIIDWDQFNENFQYYDKSIIREVIGLFIDEYDDRINTLKSNFEEKNYTSLAFNAHSFKGVIGNYMAPRAYEITRKLEETAKNNSEAGLQELLTETINTTHELYLELKEYLQKLETEN